MIRSGAFFASTPYFFLDFSTAIESIRFEARTTHLGADGFSLVGNFLWYISNVIPETVGWPQVALIFVGIFKSFSTREFKRMTLVAFLILFLVGISQPALHWARWAIQIMPILSLLAAYGMIAIIDNISKQNALLQNKKNLLIILSTMVFTFWPAYNLIFTNIRHANPTTRVLAREWMIDNLAPESTIAQEGFTVPLNNTSFQVTERSQLARDFNLSDYSETFDYIIVKDWIYQVYFDEPERYPKEIEFYRALFSNFRLVKQFEPSLVRGGPRIEIYDLKNQLTNH